MTTAVASPVLGTAEPASAPPRAVPVHWLYALVGALALMHLSMAFGRSVNWDEFWFYSQVETVARGEFIKPLQTIHTRVFHWWLPEMGGTSIDHILIARGFMWVCLMVAAGGIYFAAKSFSDKRTALLVVAAYLGSGYVLHHGTAFRVDPIVTAFLSTGFAIAACTRLRWPAVLALGLMIGCAAMVTIKFVLWAPAFAGLALWRWQDEDWDKTYPLRWIAAGILAVGVFAALYLWHSVDLAEQTASARAAATLERSADRMFGFLHSPHLDIVMKGAAISLPLLAAAGLVLWRIAKMGEPWTRRVAILAMWFPLLTPVFYFNSYPYFYVFILPPVAIACAFSIPFITQRYGQATFAAIIGLSALAVWMVDARGVTERQQQLVETTQTIMPEHANYFDCCGILGSYPKANHFLTRWGVAVYQSDGEPHLLNAMQEKPVPLLIDNNRWFFPNQAAEVTNEMHPDDAKAVRETYVQYWGNVYLAGRSLDAGEALDWEVHVPGTYTVRGEIVVDGEALSFGDTLSLDRGKVRIENVGADTAMLVWGDNPHIPQEAPPQNYWTGF